MDLEKLTEKANVDCLHFKGYIPCKYNKKDEFLHCETCSDYKKVDKNILILKLAAAGEVIRNTPLLRKIKAEYPNSKIFWLTEYPNLIPKKEVFKVCDFNQKEIELIKDVEFDILYSLDKHEEIGALANQIKSKVKKGFSQKNGVIVPFDKDTKDKWITGIFDDEMKKNKKHYVEEIFDICGFKFNGEEYMLPEYNIPKVSLNKNKKIVALNTSCGDAWKPRTYSEEKWTDLASILVKEDYETMIVGGPDVHEKNKRIANNSGAKYFGHYSYSDFIGLLSLSDVVVTPVTFALHSAIGLKKNVVLLNNVFNKSEFHLYGRGVTLEPDLPCLMCYKNDFDERCPTKNCMDLIKPEKVLESIKNFK
jgi:ADP-heptose:LPS heptosyltransferase